MGSRPQGGRRAAAGLAMALGLLALPPAADAAALRRVRIGVHPEFTRVVFETDAPAAYRIEPLDPGAGEIRVRIEATTASIEAVSPGADVPLVTVEPEAGGAALARIRATGPVRIEEQVLEAPPRIVLDFRTAVPAPAAVAPARFPAP
ncbi:MAG: hypothetical protein QNK03_25915, partial [Myxococcota bacterium]|nr:hypothetical protein [Myxococcota bacterium]